jgi:hypothetical protein
MDFYSNKKRTKIIRYILIVALLISVFINSYTSYFDIKLKYSQSSISSILLLISLLFTMFNPKNEDN